MNRREVLDNLRNEDPDYVVDVLNISSRELIRAFPSKVRAWLAQEVEDAGGTDDGDDE